MNFEDSASTNRKSFFAEKCTESTGYSGRFASHENKEAKDNNFFNKIMIIIFSTLYKTFSFFKNVFSIVKDVKIDDEKEVSNSKLHIPVSNLETNLNNKSQPLYKYVVIDNKKKAIQPKQFISSSFIKEVKIGDYYNSPKLSRRHKTETNLNIKSKSESMDSVSNMVNEINQNLINSNLLNHRRPMLNKEVNTSQVYKRDKGITIKLITQQRENLPIFQLKDDLLAAIFNNQILILIGETGSGKTTQMTQYIVSARLNRNKKIACTQPRRVAAKFIATRVAKEYGCKLGQEVGYRVRFENHTSARTKIAYLTDGMLMNECLFDPNLSQYSVIILDEAHERTVFTDVLFGLLKEIVKKRKDLKLIVTSATLDSEKFSDYFFNAPIFKIPGKIFEVEVIYEPVCGSNYYEPCLHKALDIHMFEPPGDIILFLTGQDEIDKFCEEISEEMKRRQKFWIQKLLVLPIYSSIPSEQQSKVFEPTPDNARKLIVATNVAETSITIDGIFYVIDPGYVKQMIYDSKLDMNHLKLIRISQAQANQRKGRAGRTGPGKCYRLYSEKLFNEEMSPSSIPEIQRISMTSTVLLFKAMGINDLSTFDFMDAPSQINLKRAVLELQNLGALDKDEYLTPLGDGMSKFPLDPMMAKTLIMSFQKGCCDEILTIVSMLNADPPFYRPKHESTIADEKKELLVDPNGDHLTLLALYNQWLENDCSSQWCRDNFINDRSMIQAQDIRQQLTEILYKYSVDINKCGSNDKLILDAIMCGYSKNVATKQKKNCYIMSANNAVVYLHPSSVLFHSQPDRVVFSELIFTTKPFMRVVTALSDQHLGSIF